MSIFAATVALFAFSAAPAALAPEAPEPFEVVGGSNAPTCGWPSAVQLADPAGQPFCTGSLVDSRTVLTAAHCIDPATSAYNAHQVIFGESAFAGQGSTPIQSCSLHPNWTPGNGIDPATSFLSDLAVCTLAADALDVPIVPPLMGCEADNLVAGGNVVIVGYGINNEAGQSGAGIKRWANQTIQSVDLARNDLTLLGAGGTSACFGDSGGPVYVQLPDGSWRVAGVASTAHPDTWGQSQVCGYGVVYDLVHTEMAWFEGQTGRDLTPCHDADGTWNPDERCDEFPMELTPAGVSWGPMCHGGMVSGLGSSCGMPYGEPPPGGGDGDPTGGDPTGGDPTGGDPTGADSAGDGDTDGDDDTGDESDGDTDGDDEDTEGESDDMEDSDGLEPQTLTGWGPSQDRDLDEGCGCKQSSGGGPLALVGLVLGLATRRRRRSR